MCKDCGSRLLPDAGAVVFVCRVCRRAHESGPDGLLAFSPLLAAATSGLSAALSLSYLPVWRIRMDGESERELAHAQVPPLPARAEVHVYIPAFSLARMVVQNLGVRLTQRQPLLAPVAEPIASRSPDPAQAFVPVLIRRREARLLSEFVYVALGVRTGRREEVVDDELEMTGEELVLIPAVPDPRCVHDAGWRVLLREFDV